MKKITSLVISAVFVLALVVSLVACGSSSSGSGSSGKETQVVGKVTAVDGSKVTIDTSDKDDSSEPGEGGETPPTKPEDEDEGNRDGNSQAAPSTDANAQVSAVGQREASEDNGDADADSTTITITITDTSVLYKKENGTEVQATLDDIKVGVTLTITYVNQKITKIVISGNGGGGGGEVIYDAANKITSATSETGKTYESDTADEIALLIDTSDKVTITNPTLTKTGDSKGGDNCNFYGQNAGLLVKGGSAATISGGTINTNATGANAVFSYGGNGGQNDVPGDGTTVTISNTKITTKGDGSGGIMTTGGGITKASDLTITTNGQSSAPIRTDRGGGTVTVEGGSYTSNGLGSPAIYSTADVTVSDATLVSNLSEGVCIEGKNSVELNDVDLTANNTKCNGNATFLDTIMLYQSMSGDASKGTADFTMNGGTLTSKSGHVFHVTNTVAVIELNKVDITNEDSKNILLSVCDDGWTGAKNIATLNASEQVLKGAVLVGKNSTLTMKLTDGSSFEGYIDGNITNAKGTVVSSEVGTVNVTLEGTSTWTLTADSYITSFTGDKANINTNGHKLYVNGVLYAG